MLSKSKGQILRVAGVLHVLFHLDSDNKIPNVISEDAIRASIDFADVCCQHAAHIAGRGDIEESIQNLVKGWLPFCHLHTCIKPLIAY